MLSVLKLVSRFATRRFNNVWTSRIVIWHADKWYINLFPAATEMKPAHSTMAKLFMNRMTVKSFSPSDEDVAEILRDSSTARKRSPLPLVFDDIIWLVIASKLIWQSHRCYQPQSYTAKTSQKYIRWIFHISLKTWRSLKFLGMNIKIFIVSP